jgi:uncharacterized protein (DUF3084 family)
MGEREDRLARRTARIQALEAALDERDETIVALRYEIGQLRAELFDSQRERYGAKW